MSEFRILVTGSRLWTDTEKIERVFSGLQAPPEAPITLIHGGCAGLDELAAQAAAQRGWYVEPWPITSDDWIKHGKLAGPLRNRAMVDSGADICYGFPYNQLAWGGTLGCMTMADMAGIPVYCQEDPDRWHAKQWMIDKITV